MPTAGITTPILVHAPHSSVRIPPHIRPTFVTGPAALATELHTMTDHFTDELFDSVCDLGGAMFVNRISRLVMDPERFPNDDDEPMAANGMGAIYRLTSSGAPLRSPSFGATDRALLMQIYQAPYARALEQAVTDLLDRFGTCTILDAHSFPLVPFPWEDPSLPRPEFCLGHEPFHADQGLTGALEYVLRDQGFGVEHNVPFARSYVPLRYYRQDPRVRSIMVEVRRDLYMDMDMDMDMDPSRPAQRSGGFERIRKVARKLLVAAAQVSPG